MDKKVVIILFVLKVIVVFGVLCFFNYLIAPLILQHDTVEAQKYDIIYEYKNDLVLDDSFYILTNILTFDKKNGLKSEILMQKPVEYSEHAPFGYTKILNEKEIVITQNLASELDVYNGDILEFHNPVFDLYYNYVITGILPVSYGLYENNVDRKMGVIIVGYDKDIASLVQLDSVLMADYSYAAGNTGMILKESHNNEIIIDDTAQGIIRYILAGVILIIGIGYVFWRLYYYYGIEIVKRMFTMGSTRKNMIRKIKFAYKIPNLISDSLIFLTVSCMSILSFRFIPLWVLVPIIMDAILICFFTHRSIAAVRKEN
ncbi:MAG: hypothetical protein IKP88_04080 [Lachnospiraceae bacterium]|nr:hypothetical protein [Lachnospiraceae bacterium]